MVEISQLAEFSFFKNFNKDQLKKLASMATEESYKAGTQMYQSGDVARSLYLVKEGKVALLMDNYMGPGKPPMPVTIDIPTKGESMGWSAVVEPFMYTLTARCMDDTKLISFDSSQLRKLMDEDANVGFRVMQAVARVMSSRLTHTRIILVGERGLSTLTEY